MSRKFALALIILLAAPVLAFAQTPPNILPVDPGLPGGYLDNPNTLMLFIIQLLLGIVGTISVLFIIIGGFQYILSGANEDLAKKGKTTLTNAVIGLTIVILSYVIVVVVVNTFIR